MSDDPQYPAATPAAQPAPAAQPPVYAPPPAYVAPAAPPASYPSAGYPQAGYPQAGYPQVANPQTSYPQSAYGALSPAYPPPRRRSGALGLTALLVALAAVVIATIVGGVAAANVGPQFGIAAGRPSVDGSMDLSYLSPVRSWVLAGEVSFWVGTLAGIAALVMGIIAIATRRGRGAGIGAVIVAALGPFAFTLVVFVLLTTTAATTISG